MADALASAAPAGPLATVAVTTTPASPTGLPPASCSWSTGCCASGAPLCAALEGWVVMLRRAAAPAVPVAVKVTGLPLIPDPAAAAVSVLAPAADPSVHDVAAATPFAPVGTGDVGFTDPPPEATANVTLMPATGLPLASRTITDGGVATALPAGADWSLPASTAIAAAGPALTAIAPEATPVKPVALKPSV